MADTEISLQGWDAAFAVDFNTMNAAIAAQGTTPPSFSNSEDGMGAIAGTWSPWEIVTGGDGQDVNLKCTIQKGSATPPNGQPIDLSGMSLTIQVRLIAVEDASQPVSDPTSAAPAPGSKPLVHQVNTDNSDPDNPPVTVMALPRTIPDPKNPNSQIPNPLRPFQDLFQDWFTDNIKDFGHVFSAAMLNLTALDPNMQWLKPTHLGYAVVDIPASAFSPASGVFATLMLLNNSSPPSDLAHQIDPQVLTNLPDGANSAYIISGEQFIKNVLLHGVLTMFKGATADQFDVQDGDQLEVSNKVAITWGNLDLGDGYTASPVIPAGGFMARVVEDKIELNFTGIYFNAPEYHLVGEDVVTINYIQYSHPFFHKNTDGSFGLTATDQAPGTPNQFVPDVQQYSFTAALNDSARTFSEAMAWTGVALSIIPVGVSLVKGAMTAVTSVVKVGAAMENMAQKLQAGTQAVMGADDLASGLTEAAAAMRNVEKSEDFIARAASTAKTLAGITTAIPAGWMTAANRVAAVMGLGAAITGVVYSVGQLEDIAAQNDIRDGLPPVTNFLANCLAPTKIPGTGNWTPIDMRLAKSWLLYGNLSTTSTTTAPLAPVGKS